MKTLRETTDDAQTAYFREVICQTGGNYEESAKIMGISVATYYRRLCRLFPVPRYSKSSFVLAVKRDEKGKLPDGQLPPSEPAPIPTAAPSPSPVAPEVLPPPVNPFTLTEEDMVPGPYYLVRKNRNVATITDVDWANREVDFMVGPMPKRQTVEDFLKGHIKAMV